MDRCDKNCLTKEQAVEIMKLVIKDSYDDIAKSVLDRFYLNIGKGVVKQILWLVGAMGIGYAIAKGWVIK